MSDNNDEQSTTLDQRLAAVHESILNEPVDASEPASDADTASPPSPSAATDGTEADSDASADDPVAARKARLEEYERQAAERRQARQVETEKERQVAALQQELEQLREQAQARPDISKMDVPDFLRFAREKGISPEALGEYFRADPDDHVRAAAESVVDKRIAALQEQIREQRAVIDEFRGQYQSAQQQQLEQQAKTQFFGLVRETGDAPRTKAFLEQFGESDLYEMALSASASLPEGVGFQAIVDRVEETLDRLSSIYSQTPAASPNASAARAQARTTVSNRTASGRSEVHEPQGLEDLSYEERVAVLSGAQRIS